MRIPALAATLAIAGALAPAKPAAAQAEPFIGQLMLFGGSFCPRGWAKANGQLLAISSNTALFSLLGTIYGGDGRTTFALPDLRGRAPIGEGSGPGLPSYGLGERGGAATTTLTTNQMPSHSHSYAVPVTEAEGDTDDPAGAIPATAPEDIYSTEAPSSAMPTATTQPAGGNQPVSIQDPFLAMTWCIALTGIYPSRT